MGAANVDLGLVSSDFGKDWVNPHCKVSLTREGVPWLAVYIELWSLNIDQVDIALAGWQYWKEKFKIQYRPPQQGYRSSLYSRRMGRIKAKSKWELSYHLRQLYSVLPFLRSVPFRSSVPELLHSPCSAYISWYNGRILMFKVSKQPYWSPLHDRIICKWRQCLLGGQKWN